MIVDVRTGFPDDDAPLWMADHEPTWRDATVGLEIGIGVVPRLAVLLSSAESREEHGMLNYDVEMELRFSPWAWDMRYKVQSVKVNATGDSEITGTQLREVRVAELMRAGASRGIFLKLNRDEPPASFADWYGDDGPEFDQSSLGQTVRDAGPQEWVLKQVALHYQLASVASQPPAKAIAETFGLTARTADNWISKAKKAGILKPVALATPPAWEPTRAFEQETLFRMQQGRFKAMEGNDVQHQEET
ncbi:hypothetical protein [Leifsonia sp. Le1]|uniref:hypothetical protein n=1 Tax=Leifsonia sp. Le1 TaxID=3404918 RepID=UPI003EB93C00